MHCYRDQIKQRVPSVMQLSFMLPQNKITILLLFIWADWILFGPCANQILSCWARQARQPTSCWAVRPELFPFLPSCKFFHKLPLGWNVLRETSTPERIERDIYRVSGASGSIQRVAAQGERPPPPGPPFSSPMVSSLPTLPLLLIPGGCSCICPWWTAHMHARGASRRVEQGVGELAAVAWGGRWRRGGGCTWGLMGRGYVLGRGSSAGVREDRSSAPTRTTSIQVA